MTSKQANLKGMDPLVLIDSLAVIMGHEEKELCKPGHLALVLILETAINILGSKQKARKFCSYCIHSTGLLEDQNIVCLILLYLVVFRILIVFLLLSLLHS
jgi:hypothetical protein